VTRELPDVAVIDLPEDPALYVSAIERAQLFPVHRITAEDLGRNQSYQSRALVAQAQAAGGDVAQFLQSLDPVVVREEVGPGSLERIVQLIAKTNQFKLNPRTFTADEIVAFGDAVTSIEHNELRILNWVMSCRVFCRELEHATLKLLGAYARAKGVRTFRAPFKASAKNSVAREVLTGLGFAADEAGDFVLERIPQGGQS
jgi:predicted enzyme involved in methoxymalonyl-ACP biosynthesis